MYCMAHKLDYQCPRCGYETYHRSSMRNHLYKKNKPCPAYKEDMQLTDDIKAYVLDNHVYRAPEQTTEGNRTRKLQIPNALKVACWNKYVGEDVGKTDCMCCKSNKILQHTFHCGHIIPESMGGELTLENLRPICSVCNYSMRTTNMRDFAKSKFNVDLK